ncbi:hypothetical protein BP6252_11081 [Coleophoma cylindrospora]|uniref:Uncharacterized protein n=1 Tax=Coleophoma cylindrospora TaxID=1849047 RepID=A0A3D8QNX9_9HELO|nr:hypothetical protein BP6252_11081 [Coleophoma cylindrospora]
MLRLRTSIVLATFLIATYISFSRSSIRSNVQLFQGNSGSANLDWALDLGHRKSTGPPEQRPIEEQQPENQYKTYEEEHEALKSKTSAGSIFGNTLNNLVDTDEQLVSSATLRPTGYRFENATLYEFNPYPEYNSAAWKAQNQGKYVECDGPAGRIPDMLAFSGHSKPLADPPMGSNQDLDINSNLCFERKTRLGPYGYVGEDGDTFMKEVKGISTNVNWDKVSWGKLQKQCIDKNAGRYSEAGADKSKGGARKQQKPKRGTRTALLLRGYTGMVITDDEKQTIRTLVTELSLKSGGEYEVFLLVQQKDDSFKIENNQTAYQEALKKHIPQEFWDISVLWTDSEMQNLYPTIPGEFQNVHRSQWFSVQKFAQDYPHFDFYWNWELDSRYTGHHYDFLEKLGRFGAKQPRKGLWERSNRYYIPKVHGAYDTYFRKQVEKIYGRLAVWGAVAVRKITPKGPSPPTWYQSSDDYAWGVGDDADYITVAPIYNPQTSGWIDRDAMTGYEGAAKTPRRATIGTQSRCSRKLLQIMHEENQRGNHVSSEMTPQTVALHHGLKAVYAPIPMWFDVEWDARSLDKWFNPGKDRDSGGGGDASPFSWGGEGKFSGSTWYYRAISPMRLWNNFLGWEDTAVGGSEWEKTHGRTCLPPMLLHPIKDVQKPPPNFVSTSPLPY